MIGTVNDNFGSGVAMDGKVQLILHGSEETFGGSSGGIIINLGGVDVGDFLVALPLTQANLAYLGELPLEEFVGEVAALLQAFRVHRPALNRVVFDDLARPFAELHGALIFNFEANGNDGLKVVVLGLVVFAVRSSY